MSGRPEPRLRGVVHQYVFFATIAAGLVLIGVVDGERERLALAIYTAAAAAMLGASALYHRVPWRTATARMRARRIDHSMIFVFIASTYTAFALLAFRACFASSCSRSRGPERCSGYCSRCSERRRRGGRPLSSTSQSAGLA